jgi:hypothetical protein
VNPVDRRQRELVERVNVFGDLACIPGRPADLAAQGARFVPAG